MAVKGKQAPATASAAKACSSDPSACSCSRALGPAVERDNSMVNHNVSPQMAEMSMLLTTRPVSSIQRLHASERTLLLSALFPLAGSRSSSSFCRVCCCSRLLAVRLSSSSSGFFTTTLQKAAAAAANIKYVSSQARQQTEHQVHCRTEAAWSHAACTADQATRAVA